MKILNKTKLKKKRKGMRSLYQYLLVEIEVTRKLNHPAVIHLFEVIDDPSEDEIFLSLIFFYLLYMSILCSSGVLS
jgi:hypothetical protein